LLNTANEDVGRNWDGRNANKQTKIGR